MENRFLSLVLTLSVLLRQQIHPSVGESNPSTINVWEGVGEGKGVSLAKAVASEQEETGWKNKPASHLPESQISHCGNTPRTLGAWVQWLWGRKAVFEEQSNTLKNVKSKENAAQQPCAGWKSDPVDYQNQVFIVE